MQGLYSKTFDSTGSGQTFDIASRMGGRLRGGEIIELVGDLGSGKTTFVRGLAQGMGSADHVHSPSFTISNQYNAGKLTLHHFDFHRLDEPGILQDELAEALEARQNVIVIEWAGIVQDLLPPSRLSITFKTMGENSRKLICEYPVELEHLC